MSEVSQTYKSWWGIAVTDGAEEPMAELPEGYEWAGEWFPMAGDPVSGRFAWRRPAKLKRVEVWL